MIDSVASKSAKSEIRRFKTEYQLPAYQMGSFSFSSFDLKSTRILLSL
jgi:hypothetical protein